MINLKNDEQIEEFIRQHYRIFLERDADEEGLHHYITLLKSGGLKPEQLRNKFEESAEHQRLKSKTELVDKIKKDLEEVLINSKTFEEYLEKSQQKPEPEHIFVTCYNENNSKGGLFLLKNDFTLESIFEAREKEGEFTSLYGFCEKLDLRKVNKRVLESLIKAGALDSFGGSREDLLANLPVE